MARPVSLAWQALALAFVLSVHASAANPPDEPLADPALLQEVPPDSDVRCSLGAAALFGLAIDGQARPLSVLSILRAGDDGLCWTLVDTSSVRPFPDAWRGWISDGKPILDDPQEADAYAKTLILAHWTDADALNRAARSDLTYVQLFRESAKYRGQIVRISGRMKRIRRYDDPPETSRKAGVAHIYEGWLFNGDFGEKPVCCVFTDLPDGLRVAERMEEQVEFAGYFFKRYRYKAGDTPGANQWRDAPLLVGRIVAVRHREAVPSFDSSGLLVGFLTLVGATVALVVFLTWWLRRGDERVRRRLANVARPFDLESDDTRDRPRFADEED